MYIKQYRGISHYAHALISVLLFVCIFCLVSYSARYGISDLLHDAMTFKPALDLSNGLSLYRDSYLQYGPVPVLLQALSIKVFGPTLLPVRYGIAFGYAASSVMLLTIWVRLCSLPVATLGVVFWIFLQQFVVAPLHTLPAIYAMFFQIVTIFFLSSAVLYGRDRYFLFSGLFASVTFFCKQNVGVYLIAATIFSSFCLTRQRPRGWIDAIRPALMVAFGAISLLGVVLFSFWYLGVLDAWIKETLIWPYHWEKLHGKPSIFGKFGALLFPASGTVPDIFYFRLLGIVTFFYSSLAILHAIYPGSSLRFSPQLTINSLVAGASWLQFYPIPGATQLGLASTPMIGIFLYLISSLTSRFEVGRPSHKKRWYAPAAVLFIILPVLLIRSSLLFSRLGRDYIEVKSANPLRGLLLPATDQIAIDQISDDIAAYLAFGNQHFNAAVLEPYNTSSPMVLTFVPNHIPFHPLWFPEHPGLQTAIFPTYFTDYKNYIELAKPNILIARTESGEMECVALNSDQLLLTVSLPVDYRIATSWAKKISWFDNGCLKFAILHIRP